MVSKEEMANTVNKGKNLLYQDIWRYLTKIMKFYTGIMSRNK